MRHVALAGGLDMAYRASGTGPVALILVHGYSLSSLEWSKVMPLVAGNKYTVYAVDLRGFGDSGKPETGNDYAHLVADLASFMDALHLRRAVMVGHSLAGAMLQDFAVAHGDRVAGLVLSDSLSRAMPPVGISAAIRSRIEGYGGAEANRSVFEAAVPRYFDAANVTPADLRAFVDVALKSSDPALKGLLTELYTASAIPADSFAKIAAPTLLMVGAHDTLGPLAQASALAEALPNLYALEIVPRSGHSPMWEQPETWAALLREFLDARIKPD